MGADRGIHVMTDETVRIDQALEPLAVARLLKKVSKGVQTARLLKMVFKGRQIRLLKKVSKGTQTARLLKKVTVEL